MAPRKSTVKRVRESGADLQFIVTTELGKPNPELRKKIRSYVMLGKNRGKKRACNKRVVGNQDTSLLDLRTSSAAGAETVESTRLCVPSPKRFSPTFSTNIAQPLGPLVSGVEFAEAVEPCLVESVLRFSSIAKQAFFPLETSLKLDEKAATWLTPLTADCLYLHAAIFVSQYFFGSILPRKPGSVHSRTLWHFQKTLVLLRERLTDEENTQRFSDTTLAVIVNLAGYAHLTGDLISARNHIEGLHRILRLKGETVIFRRNAKLLIEVLRCGIAIALNSGLNPVFAARFAYPGEELQRPDLHLHLLVENIEATYAIDNDNASLPNIGSKLLQAWNAMAKFCSMANDTVQSSRLVSTELFLDTMASVMYRLLGMSFGSITNQEAIRLGLLSFCCSVFLQRKDVAPPYQYLRAALKAALTRLTSCDLSPQLFLWLLVIGSLSVFGDEDRNWLDPLMLVYMDLCQVDSWGKLLRLLKQFMWIDSVHDNAGKRRFHSITAYLQR